MSIGTKLHLGLLLFLMFLLFFLLGYVHAEHKFKKPGGPAIEFTEDEWKMLLRKRHVDDESLKDKKPNKHGRIVVTHEKLWKMHLPPTSTPNPEPPDPR